MRAKLVTHYDNLKVAYNAPDVVIRAAYRALVQQFHPDKCADRKLADHRIRIINKAYEVLSDPSQRKAHDAWIAAQGAAVNAKFSDRACCAKCAAAGTGKKTVVTAAVATGRLEVWGRRLERMALGVASVLLLWLIVINRQG